MKLYAVYRYIQYKITIYIIIQRWFDRLPSCSSGQDRVIQMPRCQQRLHLKRLQHLKRLHANMLGTCCMICMMLYWFVRICLDLLATEATVCSCVTQLHSTICAVCFLAGTSEAIGTGRWGTESKYPTCISLYTICIYIYIMFRPD